MIFNNNFKRAGFIFSMMVAFSYNVGAMEALETSKAPSQATFPKYYQATKGDEEFTILGTNHFLPVGILPRKIQEYIKEHDFCLKEVNDKLPDPYEMALKESKALLDQHEPLRQEFLANREAWLETVDTPSLFEEMKSESEEEIKYEEEESDLSIHPPEGLSECYEEWYKQKELGFQLLFHDLVQGGNRIKFESLNEIGRGKLDYACWDIGKNKQDLEQLKLEQENKKLDKRHYYIYLEYLRKEHPKWFKPDGDTTDYLDQLTESQRAILNDMFANPAELVHFNPHGLFGLHDEFLCTNGMDKTIEYWVKCAEALDHNDGCRNIRSIYDDYQKFLGLSRESYDFHPTKKEISDLRDKLQGLIKSFDENCNEYEKNLKVQIDDYTKCDWWERYLQIKGNIRNLDEKLKGAFDTFESRLKVLKEKFQKLGYDPDHKPSTSDTKISLFAPTRAHTVEELGKMLEKKSPDGTYEHLYGDAASYFKNDPSHKKPSVAGRNKLWIPIILEHSQQIANGTLLDPVTKDRLEKMIVVCGYAHLYDGPESKGILSLLHEQGYTIKEATSELEWLPFFTDEPLTIEPTQKLIVEESKNS